MDTSKTVDTVMKQWFLSEEARSLIPEILRYEDVGDLKDTLDLLADECY